MRVAFILPSLKNSAPINVAIANAKQLSKNGVKVDIFYLRDEIEIQFDSDIIYRPISFFSFIKWSNYDIVHSHMLRPDLFVFLRKPLFTKTKFFSTIHNYVYPELKNYYNNFISYIFGTLWLIFWLRFDFLITLTKHSKNYYKKILLIKKIDFVYNGRDILIDYNSIDISDVKFINSLKTKFGHVIGVYCALIKRKRVDIIINHLSRTKFGALVVLGEGKERINLENLVKNLNLSDRVIFLGKKYNAHQYNCLFDIFCIPSEDEGFGLSLIEAALHKKNIICSDIDVFKELFDDNCVTYFELKNESTIDHAIITALSNKTKSINAHKKAVEIYSEYAMSSRYHQLYIKILL